MYQHSAIPKQQATEGTIMNEIECIPSLTIAEKQLTELETAISVGNYSALQNILLRQAISLHQVGVDFMQKSEESVKLRYKQGCTDIAIRAFGQSLKAMRAVKEMGE